MEVDFIPLSYEDFDFQGKNYIKIIGKTRDNKRICLIDSCDVFFWAILKDSVSEKKLKELHNKIEKIKVENESRVSKVIKTEIKDKNFLGNKVKAIKIFITNHKDADKFSEKIKEKEIKAIREIDLNYITRYILEKKLIPLTWHSIKGNVITNIDDFGGLIDSLDVDLVIKVDKISETKTQHNFIPKVLAIDIETKEFEIGKGEILMISLVSEGIKKVLTTKKIPNSPSFVEIYKDEEEMIESFIKHTKKISPDIITGYFSDGFDFPYLKARAEKNKIKLTLGLDNSVLKFSGGQNPRGKISGIVHVDLLKFISVAYSQYLQSETLSLGEVSKELLGDKKIDHEFKPTENMSNEDWKKFFEYNLQDSILTYNLFNKTWNDMAEFCRITQEPLFNVTRDGMSSQVDNYIIHNLEKYNEIIEEKPRHEEIGKRRLREKYEGAFVLQPIPKLYENIAMFDFTSYWPSIIATFNLSRSTYLGEKKPGKSDFLEVDIGNKKYYFSKNKGFFPEMLEEIIKKRKQYKEDYKKLQNNLVKARSNAFKLLANASYGYQGFFGARYYCPEASASATSISRDYIKKVINDSEKSGFKVIYSDSVDGKTKVIVKKNGIINEEFIESLFQKEDSKNLLGKEYDYKRDIEVLTLNKNGRSIFKPINYIMRHKCNKIMYRVHFTNNWYIDVTEDHSLIGYERIKNNKLKKLSDRLIEVKPTEIKKKLNSIVCLKTIPSEFLRSKDYPKEVYEFAGYFIGDGSFMRNKSHTKNNKDYYLRLSLGKDSSEVFDKLITPLIKNGFIKNYWWSKSREGDLVVNGLKLINIISKEFRSINGKKIIPDWLFHENERNIASFLRGLFSADGCVMVRNNAPVIKYTSIYEEYIDNVRKLLYKIGVSHSVFKENTINKYKGYSRGSYSKNIILKDRRQFIKKVGFLLERKNKLMNIKTNSSKTKNIKDFEFDLQSVKEIKLIDAPEYVYDLEVDETHCFFANYVLAHNTDSIALEMNKKSKTQALEFLGSINKKLPGIMELELEDFYKRGIWVTTRGGKIGAKKKYALINEKGKLKIRGFETVRRDWCNLARELQNKVLEKILNEGNEKSALVYTKEVINKIKDRKVNKGSIMIKTQLKKSLSDYKAVTPHVTIARKMLAKGMPVNAGMLVKYYIAESSDKKALTRDRAVFPDENKNYDIDYYLSKQILPAVENIFQVFGLDMSDIIKGTKQKTLF
ncbi:ribonuclease H-like domain-containing protein [Candidatus Pacearchaeota archaeon]|nr:ribonuclease H-like domain-containing protein [Candidatus Pacearchaeota archaeon]